MEEPNKDFIEDYNDIVTKFDNAVVVNIEWEQQGDFFNKFSMYDNSYTTIQTLGNTTII